MLLFCVVSIGLELFPFFLSARPVSSSLLLSPVYSSTLKKESMASFVTLHHGFLLQSQLLGLEYHHLAHQYHTKHHYPSTLHSKSSNAQQPRAAKFSLVELMGGRGLCNGEEGLQQELKKREVDEQQQQQMKVEKEQEKSTGDSVQSIGGACTNSVPVSEDAFEKELMGLTGGFPGGEKGLIKFIEENPPQKPQALGI